MKLSLPNPSASKSTELTINNFREASLLRQFQTIQFCVRRDRKIVTCTVHTPQVSRNPIYLHKFDYEPEFLYFFLTK